MEEDQGISVGNQMEEDQGLLEVWRRGGIEDFTDEVSPGHHLGLMDLFPGRH